jgi:hypothetical protein
VQTTMQQSLSVRVTVTFVRKQNTRICTANAGWFTDGGNGGCERSENDRDLCPCPPTGLVLLGSIGLRHRLMRMCRCGAKRAKPFGFGPVINSVGRRRRRPSPFSKTVRARYK